MEQQPTFNELLINEVQLHPQLYDQQHRACTDNGERNAIWMTIAARIDDNITGEFAKKRWLQMRDRYRKELKMAIRSSVHPKWPYFEKLCWLDPYLKDTRTTVKNNLGIDGLSFFDHTCLALNLSKPSSASLIDSLRKSEEDYKVDYPTISANSLLEKIMLATSTLMKHQQKRPNSNKQGSHSGTESSPDSATASTSEETEGGGGGSMIPHFLTSDLSIVTDGPFCSHQQQTMEPHVAAIASECQNASGGSPKSSLPNSQLGRNNFDNHHHHSMNEESEEPPLNSAIIDGVDGHSSSSSGGPTRSGNSMMTSRTPHRSSRNPPYLVRRGGSIKMRDPSASWTTANGGNSFANLLLQSGQERSSSTTSTKNVDPSNQMMPNSTSAAGQLYTETVPTSKTATAEEDCCWNHFEWGNNEDLLFARLIVVRLRKFDVKERRLIRTQIMCELDRKEGELDQQKNISTSSFNWP